MALRLPDKAKPTKVLAKRAPSNEINAEYTSGYLVIDEGNDSAELHVSDGKRAVIVPLEIEGPNLVHFESGQIPAPVIALMEKGGKLVQAKEEIEVEDEKNEATVIFHRDTQLFDGGGNLREAIPGEADTDLRLGVNLNAKRLMELATALGSEKLTLYIAGTGDPIRVEPFEGPGLAAIKPLERNAAPEPPVEQTESLLDDEAAQAEAIAAEEERISNLQHDTASVEGAEDDGLTSEERADWGEPEE